MHTAFIVLHKRSMHGQCMFIVGSEVY